MPAVGVDLIFHRCLSASRLLREKQRLEENERVGNTAGVAK